jgi:uncharacterized protein (DUF1800 family)
MLPSKPHPYRIALNRVTFGARDSDVETINAMGWAPWVEAQLSPPPGDEASLDAFIKAQTMRIRYEAPAATDTRGTWSAVDENRPLNYINAETPTLWAITRGAGVAFSSAERTRIRQELAAATWIRNAHSNYQLREFMTDFWHNHFNIGKNENELATSLLPIYDRVAIRPNVFGNFRTLLEAVATSSSMLIYLDNWVSSASTPNENFAREIMELHTLGGAAYAGTTSADQVARDLNGIAMAFTDQDVIQASRALSGWTVQYGQRGVNNVVQPNTGEFMFNLAQHNRNAGGLLGVNMATLTSTDMTQGRKFLDTIAAHSATATFIVNKLARRIFGDTPPQSVIDRGALAWKMHQSATDQIARVLRAMLIDGPEVMTEPPTKVRRPYERMIALTRTAGLVVKPGTFMTSLLDPLSDGLFAWQAPNGRPDVNSYWLATGSTVATWNLMFQVPNLAEFTSVSLANQSPLEAMSSATAIVEYWIGRMVGATLSQSAMNALVADQAGSNGIPAAVRTRTTTRIENAHRRLISLIATSEEFTLR